MPIHFQFSGVVTEYDIIQSLEASIIPSKFFPKQYRGKFHDLDRNANIALIY